MQEMHHSVQFDSDQGRPLQAGYYFHPQYKLCQEGLLPPTRALLQGQGRPILADRPKTVREDCRDLGQDAYGSRSLHHRPRRPREARVNCVGLASEGQWLAAGGVTGVREADVWVENRFREPSRGKRIKVRTLGWRLLAQTQSFLISLYFWFPNFPLFQFLMFWLSSIREGAKNTGYTCLSLCYGSVT